MLDIKIFESKDENAWCPGCGNFGLLEGIKETLAELDIEPHEVVVVSGIGQAAKMPHYLKVNGFNGLHGRALPPAQGIKLVNKDLKVIIVGGDGDAYGEGGNHFLHAIRRNLNITQIVGDNQIYGLTKGQGSPTTFLGQITSMQFEGVIQNPINPLAVALAAGATFIGRAFSGDKETLVSVLKEAINHKGYALVDVLEPCVSFNKVNTFKWYKDRVYRLPKDYDVTDRVKAMEKALEFGDKIPTGILYKEEGKATFEDLHPVIKNKPPIIDRKWQVKDVEKFLNEFK
ncbi:2-oxoacid:ferredoxin oxidoreductase subunit beta [Clostridium sp. 'White wine YQ']|uniref:2-oxoacid:ferredoxin oxidoreductase subunit beta n=1 Tax=Clostridium sp. 'White wine YQ' TaxID=3027474 RepID=UPI0023659AC5|nr:2-oxoacid:ferredoxin oxidoreductase subunit beta [Clostridium sp. 'White wine YQ']MDD7793107.1 2-oxoacid:ferredoxin oxidoreductase subunit beta [Clostridium sp. 'White wine YQ']